MIGRVTARFEAAGLHYGHGTDNAADEALFLVLHALGWSYDVADVELTRPLSVAQVKAGEAIADERIASRQPAAYLAQRMWFAGHEFFVDERVLVPRSPLAELILRDFQPWRGARPLARILDIGTGGGCIALAAALQFPQAVVDATDTSSGALEVAAINRRRHGLEPRVNFHEADLFPPEAQRYDLIISNPPYVPSAVMPTLPAEYLAEPERALVAGADGFECIDRILRGAADHLAPGGLLIVETGEIHPELEAHYPNVPFTWVEFERGGEGVFVLAREDVSNLE